MKILKKACVIALSLALGFGTASAAVLPQLTDAALTASAAQALTISSSQMSLGKGEGNTYNKFKRAPYSRSDSERMV